MHRPIGTSWHPALQILSRRSVTLDIQGIPRGFIGCRGGGLELVVVGSAYV
jgi:hypothetical protein